MKTAIKINNLCKRYGKTEAVSGLDLEIFQGELFGLLGVNGAGKTTTIKILSCLTKATSGEAFVMGHSVEGEVEAVKSVINLSPQETAVAPNLTVFENLELLPGLHGKSSRESKAMAEEYIEKMGLGEVKNKRAKALSGGWQRRLSIAMALITDPDVVFLDEPTLGLDVLARRELWRMIESLKGKKTIILTTHYLEEAEALCDRIAVMSKGKLCACGTPEELKQLVGANSFEDAFVALAERGEAK